MSGPMISRAQTTLGDVRTGASDQMICAVCDKTDKLLRCSRCKAVFYCTKEHQRRDWKRHRDFCATHPARDNLIADEAFCVSGGASSRNREIPSKQYHPVGKSRVVTANALVSNLSKIPVSDASNVTSESLHRNAKHLAGTLVCVFFPFFFFLFPFLSAGTNPALSGFARYCAVINNKSRRR